MLKASVKCISVHVRLRMFLTLTQLRCPGRLFTNSVTTQSPWRPNLAETRRRQGAPCRRGNKSGMLPRRPSSGPPLYTMCREARFKHRRRFKSNEAARSRERDKCCPVPGLVGTEWAHKTLSHTLSSPRTGSVASNITLMSLSITSLNVYFSGFTVQFKLLWSVMKAGLMLDEGRHKSVGLDQLFN